MNGQSLGPLHGLPMTIKDTIDIFGYSNTYGSYLYENYSPKQEGTCVKRLREAGAVILGVTNSPELLTAYESDNLLFGATNHPLDPTLSAGGSSGGEAAILAVNGSPLGLGSARSCRSCGCKSTRKPSIKQCVESQYAL